MKNHVFVSTGLIRFFAFLLFLVVASILSAQNPDEPTNPFYPGTTSGQVFDWWTGLYAALVSAITYIQGVFFKNSKLGKLNTSLKYLTIAAVVAALFMSMGWLNAVQVLIGFVGSAIGYDKVLKPLGLSTPR